MKRKVNKEEVEFPTKEFNLLVPFSIKQMMPGGLMDDGMESEESLTIEGFANWYGEDVDGESGEGVACDLAGDAVVPTGIDLSVYKGNPQILWQHCRDYSIGKANQATRKKQGLFVNATIYKSAMDEADWFRVKAGLITRFSIGFRTLAGEYKEVNGKNIFFITKSLLMEISIVTLPCSTESSFTIVKALNDDAFIASGEIETQPHPTEEVIKTEGNEETMKIKLKDMLSQEEVEHFKTLGLESELEIEKEVPTRTYIDNTISKAMKELKAELFAELETIKTASTEVGVQAETESTETVEEKAEVKVETEAVVEEKVKAESEKENETVEFDNLKAALVELKAVLTEEK